MNALDRRSFLTTAAKAAAGTLLAAPRLTRAASAVSLAELAKNAPRARYWVSNATPSTTCTSCHDDDTPRANPKHDHGTPVVRCQLCARACIIEPGDRGMCRARMNVGGELRSLVYGRPMAVHVDPIEKKPFYHFLPGSRAYSLATSGCPLRCNFCQNWQLSRARPEDYRVEYQPPAAITSAARSSDAPVIAFTYNEATVFTEYLTDIARDARKRNIRSVLVSCGYMQRAPLDEMCDVLAAIKIDLKGINPEFYRNACNADVHAVQRSIAQVAKRGVHLEIVNLVVPTLNDSDADLKQLATWLFNEIGPDVPVHFTRFHPDYKLLNLPPTPVATLERAYQIARDVGLRYPFVGNVPGHPGNHTHCPECNNVVIARRGFFVSKNYIHDGRCQFCGETIAGVWQ